MKLILSVEALDRQLSGIGHYTWQLASRLPNYLGQEAIRYHHQQRWVAEPSRLLHEPIDQALMVKEHAPLTKVPLIKKKPWGLRRISKWLAKPKWVRTPNWKRQCRDAVFHGPNFFVPSYADKAIITVHDLSVLRFPDAHPAERVKQYERMFQTSLNQARHLLAVSQTTKNEIIALLGYPAERISVTHLAADATYHPRGGFETQAVLKKYDLSHQQYCLSVATIEPRKNIANLINAYAQLPYGIKSRYPLILVGGMGWHSEPIHDLIAHFKPEGWLKYLGYVDQADLPLLYAGAHISAYTSVYEGFGLPVLESMASGVPVVTSNVSSLPEVSQGAALHVSPEDIDEIQLALQKAIEDVAWRQQIIQSGLAVSAHYSWDNCVQQTIAAYQKLGSM